MGPAFRLRYSMQNHSVRSFLGANMLGTTQSVWAGSLTSMTNMLSDLCFWDSRARRPAGYGAERIKCSQADNNLIGHLAALLQHKCPSHLCWTSENILKKLALYILWSSDSLFWFPICFYLLSVSFVFWSVCSFSPLHKLAVELY